VPSPLKYELLKMAPSLRHGPLLILARITIGAEGLWPEDKDRDVEGPKAVRTGQSWDCAIKDSETNSYSVCTTWLELDDRFLLVDVCTA
jgi:hypothetical protein